MLQVVLNFDSSVAVSRVCKLRATLNQLSKVALLRSAAHASAFIMQMEACGLLLQKSRMCDLEPA